jgi:DNA recombination-dependent growth factor C
VCLLSIREKKVCYTARESASDCSLMPSECLVLAISWQEQVTLVLAISWQEQVTLVLAISWQEQITLVLSQHAYLDFI